MSAYRGRGVHGHVVGLLGARIVSGRIRPGDVINLVDLGRDLDVSLTVLREAIKVLAVKGLLDARQKRGTFVRAREHWNLLDGDVIKWRGDAGDAPAVLGDLAELRAIMEPAAASLAARRRDENDLSELDAALVAMRVATDPEAEAAADLRWHRALLRATHNEMLAQLEFAIVPGLRLHNALVHETGPADPVPSHALVVDAIRTGDGDHAATALTALLHKAADDLDSILGAPAASPKETP